MCYYIITAYTDCGHTTEKFSQCLVHLHSSHRPVYCEPSQDVYLDGVLEGNVCLECRRIRNDQRRTERKILAPAKSSSSRSGSIQKEEDSATPGLQKTASSDGALSSRASRATSSNPSVLTSQGRGAPTPTPNVDDGSSWTPRVVSPPDVPEYHKRLAGQALDLTAGAKHLVNLDPNLRPESHYHDLEDGLEQTERMQSVAESIIVDSVPLQACASGRASHQYNRGSPEWAGQSSTADTAHPAADDFQLPALQGNGHAGYCYDSELGF